jgi:hypothetical protein
MTRHADRVAARSAATARTALLFDLTTQLGGHLHEPVSRSASDLNRT